MTPYIIRRDGTVVDRQSGEVVGRLQRVSILGHRGFHFEWDYLPARCRRWRCARTRREAADALWAKHERRRAESLARRKG